MDTLPTGFVFPAITATLLTVWFGAKLFSPATRVMSVEIAVLQAMAEELTDSASVKLLNGLAGVPWLRHLRPVLLAPHSTACTAPSLALRFAPLVGKSMLATRFQAYKTCVRQLLRRENAVLVVLTCVLLLTAGLLGALAWLLHRSERPYRIGDTKSVDSAHHVKDKGKDGELTEEKEEENEDKGKDSSEIERDEGTKEKKGNLKGRNDVDKTLTPKITVFEDKKTENQDLEEKTDTEDARDKTESKDLQKEIQKENVNITKVDDNSLQSKTESKDLEEKTEKDLTRDSGNESFLRRRVPFLTARQILELQDGRLVASGGFGSIRRVVFAGVQAVLKELHDPAGLDLLLEEARLMLELDGAGGVPKVLAVCLNPPAIVLEFVGRTYDEFVLECSVGGLLESLVSVCRRLGEIHAKGIVHNDVKMNNITYTGGVRRPVFHIIDLGWACRVGQVPGEFIVMSSRKERGTRRRPVQTIPETCWLSSETSESESESYMYEEDSEDSGCEFGWMAPEVRMRQPVWPSGDVYSLGFLLKQLLLLPGSRKDYVAVPLRRLANQCSAFDPQQRPALSRLEQDLVRLKTQLSPQQLAESLWGKK